MPRLDQDRQAQLEPKRIQTCLDELEKLNIEVIEVNDTRIDFIFKGEKIQLFPYSGWHTGKGIKDGRGWKNLYEQLI